jgi:type IV pilus assembly protein PilM
MPKSEAVWGIDIGNSSLKALRCRLDDRPDRIVAEAFDYIEYPKILTQPGAEPADLIADALKQFQSRNNVRGDQVAIAVSGQSGLARFIKLPPVEAKRIPDIVKYEARQQIPFDLQDVIWDYQRMGGGIEEEGFVLEAEVGLFAMKRDQVFRALEPFRKAGVEVDFVQLTPLALYNYFAFDQSHELPSADEYDPDAPLPSYVILSMGTDATDLVITNGFRVWQRSIPLGGNHFTKALTKELKLTFAKAEHLKRNASAAQDPKAVFQAMRPIFNDLLTEVQRSITYFTSINRTASIGRLVTLGNAMKLPGLQRYLSQNLGYEMVRVDSFRGLEGPEVVKAPAFRENRLCFGTCYGLALQGLGKAALKTNLLPREIVQDRMVREKKPWAVAVAAVLLLAFSVSFVGFSLGMGRMSEDVFGTSEQAAAKAISQSADLKKQESAAAAEFNRYDEIGKNLVGSVEGRVQWLELFRAIGECLPSDPEGQRPEEIMDRNELHIVSIEPVRFPNVETWLSMVGRWYRSPDEEEGTLPEVEAAAAAPSATGGLSAATGGVTAPSTAAAGAEDAANAGWAISITGYHYHNKKEHGVVQTAQFVRDTLIKNLHEKKIVLPKGDDPNEVEWVSLKDLGISYAMLINPGSIEEVTLKNPNVEVRGFPGYSGEESDYSEEDESGYPRGYRPGFGQAYPRGPMPGRGLPGVKTAATEGEQEVPLVVLRRFDFLVQFWWKPTTPRERREKQEQAEQQSQAPP